MPIKNNVRPIPLPPEDPAGLDKVLLAFGEAGARWLERFALSRGVRVSVWDGENGLGACLSDVLKEYGVPNKRFHELVTPRAVLNGAGVLRMPKKRRAG